jgi:hypothetical protein
MKKILVTLCLLVCICGETFAAEGYVQLPVDSTGKKMRTQNQTISTQDVHQQGVLLCDPTAADCADIKPPSTPAAATDSAAVVSFAGANSATKIGDGTNNAAIKAASTAAAATDPAAVVSFAGANSATKIGDGTNNAAIKAASTAAAATDPALVVSIAGANSAIKIGDGTNNAAIKAASTAPAATDPAVVVTQSPNGGNPCSNSSATLLSVTGTTSGTTALQIIALSGSTKIYICSMTVISASGTAPTFSLVQGIGSNCGTGQSVLRSSWATATTAGTVYAFANPVAVSVAGNAVCYLDTGTTPIQNYNITYVQQ